MSRGTDVRSSRSARVGSIAGELHINTLAVDGDMRRRGIATNLLHHVLQRTAVSRATLEVRRSNTAALKLYEGLGFTAPPPYASGTTAIPTKTR